MNIAEWLWVFLGLGTVAALVGWTLFAIAGAIDALGTLDDFPDHRFED